MWWSQAIVVELGLAQAAHLAAPAVVVRLAVALAVRELPEEWQLVGPFLQQVADWLMRQGHP